MNFTDAVNKVLEIEKGFVNDKNDSGGATNWGITKRVYEAWLGRTVSIDEIKNMPRSHAVAIYKANYWDKIAGDSLKSYKIAYTLFDQAINRGVSTVVKQAQSLVGLKADGIIGPATINALNSIAETDFISKFLAASIASYRSIASNDGENDKDKKFLNGWLNRVNEISKYVGVKPGLAIGGAVLLAAAAFFLIKFLGKK